MGYRVLCVAVRQPSFLLSALSKVLFRFGTAPAATFLFARTPAIAPNCYNAAAKMLSTGSACPAHVALFELVELAHRRVALVFGVMCHLFRAPV